MHAAQDYIYNKIAHASRAYRRRHSVGQLDRALKECSNERPVQISSGNLVAGGISSDLRYFGEPKPKSTNLRSRANCKNDCVFQIEKNLRQMTESNAFQITSSS